MFGKYFDLFGNMSRLFCFPKCSETFSLFRNIPECSGIFKICFEKFSNICFRNISKLFRNSKTFFKSVLKYSNLFSRLSYFQNVSKLSVYTETFRFGLEIFKKVFPNIQIFFLKKGVPETL